MIRHLLAVLACLPLLLGAADHPSATISNGIITAKLYLPHAGNGFYQGTRFDWSGTIISFEVHGHNYYGPWFDATDPTVHDFVYRGEQIVAGPCSADSGPVDEYGPLGFDAAAPGKTFVKIGVGALKRDSAEPYDNYHVYPIADGGKWSLRTSKDHIAFTQELKDAGSGYAYAYEKDLRLVSGKAQMVLTHRLKNTGSRAIETNVYNHNFLVLDHQSPAPGVSITVPFQIKTAQPPPSNLAQVQGGQILYRTKLTGHDTVAMPLEGFGPTARDNGFRIENQSVGAGISAHTDRPLLKEELWSIRSVVAMEPFVSISIAPGAEFTWSTVYDYYTLPRSK